MCLFLEICYFFPHKLQNEADKCTQWKWVHSCPRQWLWSFEFVNEKVSVHCIVSDPHFGDFFWNWNFPGISNPSFGHCKMWSLWLHVQNVQHFKLDKKEIARILLKCVIDFDISWSVTESQFLRKNRKCQMLYWNAFYT